MPRFRVIWSNAQIALWKRVDKMLKHFRRIKGWIDVRIAYLTSSNCAGWLRKQGIKIGEGSEFYGRRHMLHIRHQGVD